MLVCHSDARPSWFLCAVHAYMILPRSYTCIESMAISELSTGGFVCDPVKNEVLTQGMLVLAFSTNACVNVLANVLTNLLS